MMFIDISLDSVVSQRPLCSTLVRVPPPLSLMFPCSRSVMIVLKLSPYGVVSDGRVLGLFVPWPPAVLTGLPQETNISLEAAIGRIVFLCAGFVVFHSRNQSTLIPVPPSTRLTGIQGLSPHTLFLGSKGWMLLRTLHPMWNRGPQ